MDLSNEDARAAFESALDNALESAKGRIDPRDRPAFLHGVQLLTCLYVLRHREDLIPDERLRSVIHMAFRSSADFYSDVLGVDGSMVCGAAAIDVIARVMDMQGAEKIAQDVIEKARKA
jgi:hypothetical protein